MVEKGADSASESDGRLNVMELIFFQSNNLQNRPCITAAWAGYWREMRQAIDASYGDEEFSSGPGSPAVQNDGSDIASSCSCQRVLLCHPR